MSAEIVQFTGGALAVAADQTTWTPQQIGVLQGLGVDEKVTPAEMDMFLHECQRTALDPFTRQIYLIGRYDKKAGRDVFRSQTGIDGYRVVAHRAARRDRVELSYSDTLWCGLDGVWRDAWLFDDPPRAAKVTVFRDDKPFPAIATLSEYAATYADGNPTPMWRRMPSTMLAKCAEALALRKAFPQDLAGIYTAEEMEQADNSSRHAPEQPRPERPAQRQQPSAPADDEWSTPAPAAPSQPIEDAEVVGEQPTPSAAPAGPVADSQQVDWILGGLTAVRGIVDPQAKQAAIEHMVGRQPIPDPYQLTPDEAAKVRAALDAEWAAKQQQAPAAGSKPTEKAKRHMHVAFKGAGLTSHYDRVAYAGLVTGDAVESTDNLTAAGVDAVIAALNEGKTIGSFALAERAAQLHSMIVSAVSSDELANVSERFQLAFAEDTITAVERNVLIAASSRREAQLAQAARAAA